MGWFSDIKDKLSGRNKTINLDEVVNKIKQDKILDDITNVLSKLANDWKENRYKDKVDVGKDYNEKNTFTYRFENGHVFKLNEDLIYEDLENRTTYTITIKIRNQIVILLNTVVAQINDGIAKERKVYKKSNKSDNPKRDKYNSLLETIKCRKESLLKKMNNSERTNLENELISAENRAKLMKEKYNL